MAALYADIAAKQVRARIQQNKLGKTQYDYDSDEDTEGGEKKIYKLDLIIKLRSWSNSKSMVKKGPELTLLSKCTHYPQLFNINIKVKRQEKGLE